MKLIPLAGFDDDLRPLSPARVARRDRILAMQSAAAAKASEAELPADERRQVIDLRAGTAALGEMAMACAIAAPVACGIVLFRLGA